MKIIIYSIIIISSIFFINSCIPSRIIEKFTYKFDGKLNGIDSLCDVDGYYDVSYKELKQGAYLKVASGQFMLYRDGTFADQINMNNLLNYNNNDSKDIVFGWGHYKIFGDTIKAQSISNELGSFIYERWLVIINRQQIREIHQKCFECIKDKDAIVTLNDTAHFIPLKTRPDSSCWLKEEKWAWEK